MKPQPGQETIQIFAELEGPSLAGAYAFNVKPGVQTQIDVTARLFFRGEVERLGVAPLTSMYHFGENDHNEREDFRPEVHDSDGLFILRPNGERMWRPLKNPEELALSYFGETSPKLFGLLQRDRDFSHYEDVEAHYELRPSLVIEPMGDWGRGIVQLVEIPTNSEVNDNIVAFWVPEEKPAAGSQFEFRYRMHWGYVDEMDSHQAVVGATYAGLGGNAADTGETNLRRFEINFVGGTAQNLPGDAVVVPILEVPDTARLVHSGVSRLPGGGWRLSIELEKLDASPVELKAKLSFNQRIISETWLYQWTGRHEGSADPDGRAPASATAAPHERFFDARPAGMLVDRPDLTEEDLLTAIAERLAFDGRTGPEPQVVIEAARLGKRKALAFLRKLLLPPPRAPLTMPVRPILREHMTRTDEDMR